MICPSWLSFILYNPVRKTFQDRKKVIDESDFNSTSIVLEIGAGNGFLTEILAEHARKVYAVELQEGMVKKLQKRVQRFGDRVEIIQSDIATYKIQKEFADVCIIFYSFHEVSDKAEAARNISAALKFNGLLSIYEPTMEVTKTGIKETVDLFRSLGFSEDIAWSNLFTRFARLRKPKRM
jgi:tRNA A58 N-methylase Trm61